MKVPGKDKGNLQVKKSVLRLADTGREIMNIVVTAVGQRTTTGRARLWQDSNARYKRLMLAFRFHSFVILGFGLAFCGLSYAEQARPSEEQKEKLISITLGETTFKLPAPVHLDGKWINYDAKGKELNFSIRAVDLYKKLDLDAEINSTLRHERFDVRLMNEPSLTPGEMEAHLQQYLKTQRWGYIGKDEKLGLTVYERTAPNLATGWGSPTYIPLDKNYIAPYGTTFRISCARVSANLPPDDCKVIYFIAADISVTYLFGNVGRNIKYWRELDQALRQILYSYMEK